MHVYSCNVADLGVSNKVRILNKKFDTLEIAEAQKIFNKFSET